MILPINRKPATASAQTDSAAIPAREPPFANAQEKRAFKEQFIEQLRQQAQAGDPVAQALLNSLEHQGWDAAHPRTAPSKRAGAGGKGGAGGEGGEGGGGGGKGKTAGKGKAGQSSRAAAHRGGQPKIYAGQLQKWFLRAKLGDMDALRMLTLLAEGNDEVAEDAKKAVNALDSNKKAQQAAQK